MILFIRLTNLPKACQKFFWLVGRRRIKVVRGVRVVKGALEGVGCRNSDRCHGAGLLGSLEALGSLGERLRVLVVGTLTVVKAQEIKG